MKTNGTKAHFRLTIWILFSVAFFRVDHVCVKDFLKMLLWLYLIKGTQA
jgi:hypothetical protein